MFRSEPLVAAVTVWERRACAVIVNEDAHTRVASGQSWRTRIKRARHCVCVEGLSPRRGAKSLSTPRAGSQSRIARRTPCVHRSHRTTPRFWYIPMPEREATMQMAGRRALRPKKKRGRTRQAVVAAPNSQRKGRWSTWHQQQPDPDMQWRAAEQAVRKDQLHTRSPYVDVGGNRKLLPGTALDWSATAAYGGQRKRHTFRRIV